MSETLKPCPFCGGEVIAIETHPGRGEIYCGDCDVVMAGDCAKTPEELTEAWNTRAERTCSVSELSALDVMLSGADMQRWGVCSECGNIAQVEAVYCPNCGAKVVDA